MSKYTGKTITIDRPAQDIADKFSDLSNLQKIIDNIPQPERNKFGNVAFDADTITIDTPQAGKINLKVVERTAKCIKFKAIGTPVPLDMVVDMTSPTPESTCLSASVDVQIPMMLRPLIAPHMQKAVDMLTDVVARVAQK